MLGYPNGAENLLDSNTVASLLHVVAAQDRRHDVLPLVLETVSQAVGMT